MTLPRERIVVYNGPVTEYNSNLAYSLTEGKVKREKTPQIIIKE